VASVELIRGLAVLAEPPGPQAGRLATLLELPATPEDWQYTELFLEQLYPYASVYLGGEGKLGGDARDRVAGFWRALGESPPADPDHLALLLGLYAHLSELQLEAGDRRERQAWERARVALLWEHLLSWIPVWLAKLEGIDGSPYRHWGALLSAALAAERESLTLPVQLPLHLREAPLLPAATDVEGAEFLEHLLAPVRTGFILTRSDLADCARETGLGLRAGERRYALKALLGQQAGAVLNWLAALAERTGASRAAGEDAIGDFWRDRAIRSGRLLRAAAADAADA
jgi:TorA maturation chaperone TorD